MRVELRGIRAYWFALGHLGGYRVAMPRICLKLEQAARLAPWGGTYRVRALRGGNRREAAARGVKRRGGEGTEGRTAGPGVPRAPREGGGKVMGAAPCRKWRGALWDA